MPTLPSVQLAAHKATVPIIAVDKYFMLLSF
jgi:hypothetical protein